MDLESFKCPRCDFTHQNLNSLRIHWQKSHNLSSIELRVALFGRPTCECGCSGETHFKSLQLGFARFVNSHNNRVQNNWGHNKKALDKSLVTRQGMWERGKITNPYKGLTKHVDERLLVRGTKIASTFDVEKRKRYSATLRKNRLNGTVPTLRGKNHSRWKGGSSALQPLVRSRVFHVWSYQKLRASAFTCQDCGSQKDLEVHHDKERFADILQKALIVFGEVNESDFQKKSDLADWVAQYHIDNNVSGVVLCVKCHDLIHQRVS